ncbi:MAG: hypothetical protein CL678_06495 [Bdellovibrionaceae bacterium]|nr:hypothetical protein [Pseudobdellovibrionaceae bacterium]
MFLLVFSTPVLAGKPSFKEKCYFFFQDIGLRQKYQKERKPFELNETQLPSQVKVWAEKEDGSKIAIPSSVLQWFQATSHDNSSLEHELPKELKSLFAPGKKITLFFQLKKTTMRITALRNNKDEWSISHAMWWFDNPIDRKIQGMTVPAFMPHLSEKFNSSFKHVRDSFLRNSFLLSSFNEWNQWAKSLPEFQHNLTLIELFIKKIGKRFDLFDGLVNHSSELTVEEVKLIAAISYLTEHQLAFYSAPVRIPTGIYPIGSIQQLTFFAVRTSLSSLFSELEKQGLVFDSKTQRFVKK